MLARFVMGIVIYFLAMVIVGFSVLFIGFGGSLPQTWTQQIGVVLTQLAIPHRAPFAVAIVGFVALVPLLPALIHAVRFTPHKPARTGQLAGIVSFTTLGLYGILLLAIFALLQSAPRLTVMERLNLQFAMLGLGIWCLIAVVLAIPAGAVVNAIQRGKQASS